MDNIFSNLDQIYTEYSMELEVCEKKQKFTDGLFGFGHSIKDDPSHEKFFDRIREAMAQFADSAPISDDAEKVIQYLFTRKNEYPYPSSAQLMLCAAEKHILYLTPYLSRDAAKRLLDIYESMYKRWERLPVQTEVWKMLRRLADI